MIQLSDVFSMIGTDGCEDVASSLGMQGTDPEISIPIYEIFYLKILPGENSGFLASSIAEYNAIRQLSQNCGGVAAAINLLDLDILTLIGVELIYTPNTGMNVFMKLGDVLTGELEEQVLAELAALAGIPTPDNSYTLTHMQGEIIEILFNKAIDYMQSDLESKGINLHHWEELPNYYNMTQETGEMAEMLRYRQMIGGLIL